MTISLSEKIDRALDIIAEETGGHRLEERDIKFSLKPYFEADNANSFSKEYRLSNPFLGFGGKLRRASKNSPFSVSAYSEDMSEEVSDAVKRINVRLTALG